MLTCSGSGSHVQTCQAHPRGPALPCSDTVTTPFNLSAYMCFFLMTHNVGGTVEKGGKGLSASVGLEGPNQRRDLLIDLMSVFMGHLTVMKKQKKPQNPIYSLLNHEGSLRDLLRSWE